MRRLARPRTTPPRRRLPVPDLAARPDLNPNAPRRPAPACLSVSNRPGRAPSRCRSTSTVHCRDPSLQAVLSSPRADQPTRDRACGGHARRGSRVADIGCGSLSHRYLLRAAWHFTAACQSKASIGRNSRRRGLVWSTLVARWPQHDPYASLPRAPPEPPRRQRPVDTATSSMENLEHLLPCDIPERWVELLESVVAGSSSPLRRCGSLVNDGSWKGPCCKHASPTGPVLHGARRPHECSPGRRT